jgi:hypothetical protein
LKIPRLETLIDFAILKLNHNLKFHLPLRPLAFDRVVGYAQDGDGKRWIGLNRHLTAQLFLVKGLK